MDASRAADSILKQLIKGASWLMVEVASVRTAVVVAARRRGVVVRWRDGGASACASDSLCYSCSCSCVSRALKNCVLEIMRAPLG